MVADRPHFPNIHRPHLRPRDAAILVTLAGGLILAGAGQQAGWMDGNDKTTSGGNSDKPSLAGAFNIEPTQEPTLTPTLAPTETPTPIPTATSTPELPTATPIRLITAAPTATQRPVQPTSVPTTRAEAPKVGDGIFDERTCSEVYAGINAERAKRGLSQLQFDSRLSVTTRAHINYLVGVGYPYYFSGDAHNVDGSPTIRAQRNGYPNGVAEVGQYVVLGLREDNAQATVWRWIETSPPHRDAILMPQHRTIGGACERVLVNRQNGQRYVFISFVMMGD